MAQVSRFSVFFHCYDEYQSDMGATRGNIGKGGIGGGIRMAQVSSFSFPLIATVGTGTAPKQYKIIFKPGCIKYCNFFFVAALTSSFLLL
jgi:hypothetical protein